MVLGGSGDSQKEFIESLSSAPTIKRQPDRTFSKQAPLANDFALGYTYYDVLDADQEGGYYMVESPVQPLTVY